VISLFEKTQKWSCSVKNPAKQHHLFKCQGCVIVILSLFSVPAKLINVSRNQTVLERLNMALFCEATGESKPNITWNRVLEDGSNGEVLHQGSTWDFPNISKTASGTYRCTAFNGFGNVASQVFKVNVTCKYFTYSKHCLWRKECTLVY